MTRACYIDQATQAAIDQAVAAARADPVTRAEVMKIIRGVPQDMTNLDLKDRPKDFAPHKKMRMVTIQVGFVAAITFEDQPQAGLCRHLSVSVDRKGKLPHPLAVDMIAKAFGFRWQHDRPGRAKSWTEEFEPGERAINIVEPVGPRF